MDSSFFALQFFLNGWGRLARLLVEMPLLSCCIYLYIFGALFLAARDVYHIFRLSRRLGRGYPPDHRKNWHATARVYRISRGITLGAFSLVMVLAFEPSCRWIPDSLWKLPGFPPLCHAAGPDRRHAGAGGRRITTRWRNGIPCWRAVILEYSERGVILEDGESPWDTSLSVQYYDTRSPWLARFLVGDLHENHAFLAGEPQPLPPLAGMDAAYAYSDGKGVFRQLILVQGRRVLSVLWTDPDGSWDFDRLAPRFAEGLFSGFPLRAALKKPRTVRAEPSGASLWIENQKAHSPFSKMVTFSPDFVTPVMWLSAAPIITSSWMAESLRPFSISWARVMEAPPRMLVG